MQKIRLILYGVSLLAITCLYPGCGGKNDGLGQNTAINVEVENVKQLDDSQVITYSGTIEESESIPLCFPGIGTVLKVNVAEGSFVKKGQLLATLNNESYKNAYEMSLASLKQAEDAYKRLQPMYKNGNLPEIKLIDVETSLQQAKSATAIAKKNLADCNLYSPVDGVVGKKSIDPGMTAMPNIASINIVKIEKVFARVSVPENEIASIKKGSWATIKVSALNRENITGTVEEIGVMADPMAHSYKVKISITNKDRALKPGMICNVIINDGARKRELVIPTRAVQVDDDSRNFVYSIISDHAVKKYIQTGELVNNGITITNGISEADRIVVSGQHKLTDNSLVNIINR
jgi:membrane fusion protein, multidrug efflux system